MESNRKILLSGATGYLGGYIFKELKLKGFMVRVLTCNPRKLKQKNIEADEVFNAEITKPESIKGCCKGADTVISTVGITRQKDGLTYMDVDYQVNKNLDWIEIMIGFSLKIDGLVKYFKKVEDIK